MTYRPRLLNDLAVAYCWRQLAMRAGVIDTGGLNEDGFESLGIRVHYGHPSKQELESPCVVVRASAPRTWNRLPLEEPHSLTWLPYSEVSPTGKRLSDEDSVPVLLWGRGVDRGDQQLAAVAEGSILVFYADIIASTFFMLSRWEESLVTDRDEYGRFPAAASVAYKQGFLDRPIVDEYALILREWLKVLLPQWEPEERSFSVELSHDVDHIRRFPSLTSALRCAAGDLLKRRSVGQASGAVRDALRQITAPKCISYVQGIRDLAEVSQNSGLSNDLFYFMATGPGPYGGGYDPSSPLVRDCIRIVQEKGFDIGLHASYDAFDNPDQLAREKTHLETVVGQPVRSVRHHYLRFRAPATWRHVERAGLARDATMGYADHEGFRCGTCHPFRPFDLEEDRELDVVEVPLIAMDGTLRGYRGLTPAQAKDRILTLADRCRRVEGTFTLLWHNSSLGGEWAEWAPTYREAVGKLADKTSQGSK